MVASNSIVKSWTVRSVASFPPLVSVSRKVASPACDSAPLVVSVPVARSYAVVTADSGDVDRVARFKPSGLPDPTLRAIPILFGDQRLAEASAFAVVRRVCVDAELKPALTGQRVRQINLDRRPAVAV